MLILAEGYLKKRCANLPVMRRRYCMLVVDDSKPPPSSSSTKIKVMLRSYKNEESRMASIDSFVSSHVVKCIGEWTGKGNLHTYPNAFVVETLQSKLFHCSADSPDDKARWTSAIEVYDRLSVGSSSIPPPIDTPVSFTHDFDAAGPQLVEGDGGGIPAPAHLEGQHHIEAPDAPSSFTRPASTRPKSLRSDALFKSKSKQGRRGNYNDIDMDSDEEQGPSHVDSVHLDSALLQLSTTKPSPSNDLDDLPFNTVDVPWSSMRLHYVEAPEAAPSNADCAMDDDDEEYLDLNPDMVARFSHMRMMEARGLAKDSLNGGLLPPRRSDGARSRSRHKTHPSVVDDMAPKPKKKTKKEPKKERNTKQVHHGDNDGRTPANPAPRRDHSPPAPQERRMYKVAPPLPPPPPLPTAAPRPPPSLQLPAIDDF
ncbi:hypothetical protein, variant 1 [Aphanomyces invadans]|uniref:PH domain-containing protein n=1 Tax=Aphanomyces invadans TaxID=157072 RepID=A0A024TQ35_9STRA|nr:hypothetical protein, variant 1 [Aphanomyces invadans]ETV95422.1 hypothetical protein, variant 1 [Aphanomyces invadans]|eukprot:XP_008876123.1 hypothetical protein, variant 1 [Aphanomyces invadans]